MVGQTHVLQSVTVQIGRDQTTHQENTGVRRGQHIALTISTSGLVVVGSVHKTQTLMTTEPNQVELQLCLCPTSRNPSHDVVHELVEVVRMQVPIHPFPVRLLF